MTLITLTPPPVQHRTESLPVAIIGAGPIGLAAAAHLIERGIAVRIYEAGETVADSMRQWGHVRLFSPWRYLVDDSARRLLEPSGWQVPDPSVLPTGHELIDQYLIPLASTPSIADGLVLGAEVVGIARAGMDRTRTQGRSGAPFTIRFRTPEGDIVEERARFVIDASGTYRSPNSLSSDGLEPIGAEAAADRIERAMPDVLGSDRERFAGRTVAVVGAGHSAANTLLALAQLAEEEPSTRVLWCIRNASAVRVTTSEDDELIARAALDGRVEELVRQGRIERLDRFEIARLERTAEGVELIGRRGGEPMRIEVDRVVNATGYRPDLAMLREIRLDLDDIVEAPRLLAPLIDPNEHTCGTVEAHGFGELRQPEEGFFILGMKSYGRAPTFLLATGHEQVRSVAAWMAGDSAAVAARELGLPATGVCSTDVGGSGCCA
ncbi:NAD(P)-binding domain-containing protein [Agrococcus sp. ARC_14]|uniref:NAD(P)-binding domain-containing protein n=1 Tax=Agrococcus sp. ARC_14 TaxID=2919927 RepID=UPI001F05DDED|nr:NAD(P)-binding domain-containing protein [Agrococcus sp. ARC_14]MCH1883239.1 NAD(P)-binding domain-containing protein [Agrococcus sp. ARC_14]